MRSPVSLSVCPPQYLLNQLVDFYEVQWWGHAIESDLDAVLFNPVPSTIPKWQTFKLLRWMKNLHQSTWDHKILYTDRSSKDEQLLMTPFLSKTKNTNMAAVWMLKFIVCFVETTNEPLHLGKWTLVQKEIMDIPTSFIWIVVLFDTVFKYGDGKKFWGYVVINAEQPCVEFCNFVQCHILVNYLTFAVNEWNIKI
jgi:hypothetical protein